MRNVLAIFSSLQSQHFFMCIMCNLYIMYMYNKYFYEIVIELLTIVTWDNLFRATPAAYGSSQSRGQNGAVAAGLRCSHTRSKPHLQPATQLTAMLDP